jgi:hypothetical protein
MIPKWIMLICSFVVSAHLQGSNNGIGIGLDGYLYFMDAKCRNRRIILLLSKLKSFGRGMWKKLTLYWYLCVLNIIKKSWHYNYELKYVSYIYKSSCFLFSNTNFLFVKVFKCEFYLFWLHQINVRDSFDFLIISTIFNAVLI